MDRFPFSVLDSSTAMRISNAWLSADSASASPAVAIICSGSRRIIFGKTRARRRLSRPVNSWSPYRSVSQNSAAGRDTGSSRKCLKLFASRCICQRRNSGNLGSSFRGSCDWIVQRTVGTQADAAHAFAAHPEATHGPRRCFHPDPRRAAMLRSAHAQIRCGSRFATAAEATIGATPTQQVHACC